MGTTRRIATVLALGTTVLATASAWAKRVSPVDVPPVVNGNVRYEAPHFTNPCDANQPGGCVVAYDNTSNAQLWAVQVYCTEHDSSLEQDVQDVFITSLTLSSSGQVQVANEAGRHFAIDPATRKVTGDATGCGEGSSSGCSYTSARSETPTITFLCALGLVGLMGLRRLRPVRPQR